MSPDELDNVLAWHISELSKHFDAIQIIARLPSGKVHVGRKGNKIKLGTEEKFWARVDKSNGPDSCWPFSGGYKAKGGHGQVVIGTRNNGGSGILIGAHRLAWTLTNGKIPKDLCVCHKCDNPPCCNPTHLFLGTALENFDDMRRKGRANGGSLPGEQNKNSKLKSNQVNEIRLRYSAGESQKSLAREYGVLVGNIAFIIHGKTWKHLL